MCTLKKITKGAEFMLKYTFAAINIVSGEVSKAAHIMKIIFPSLMSAYLLTLCILKVGHLWFNIAMLAITLVGLCVYLITKRINNKASKSFNAVTGRALKFGKMLINLISVVMTVYVIAVDRNNVSTLKVVTIPIVIIVLALQFTLEITSMYLSNKLKLFWDAIQMDFEPILKIHEAKQNIIGALAGQETTHTAVDISEKNAVVLKDRANEMKTQKRDNRKTYWKNVFSNLKGKKND